MIPNDDGWIIFKNYNSTDGIRVLSLIHAGNPENFYCVNKERYDAHRAEYLLSSGLRRQNCKTLSSGFSINPRKWDMYKDKELDKKGYIKDIHLMTYQDAKDSNQIRDTGSAYFLASAGSYSSAMDKYFLYYSYKGYIGDTIEANYSVRPIIELVDNVFISSGTGTKDDPYILRKD